MKTVKTTIAALALAMIANDVFGDNDAEVNLITPAGDIAVNATSEGSGTELTAVDVFKNPGISVNASDLPSSMFRRQTVTYDEIEYSSAGRILRSGNESCSGNAIELEEYVTEPENGILVSTAAHCIVNGKPSDQYSFVLDFMDENNVIQTHTYTNPQIWVNPRTEEDIPKPDVDQALMFFPDLSLPDKITPARLEIYSEHIIRDFGASHFNGLDITAVGYSQDMFGLSRDTDCNIKTVRVPPGKSPYLKTNCQINFGGSGSGLIFEDFENEAPNQKTIGAIDSAMTKNKDIDADDFASYFSLIYHHQLAEVPFLRRKDICARVTAERGSHMHYEPTYNDSEIHYTTLPFNETVYVTDMLYDEQERYGAEDVWLEIRRLDNPEPQSPDGYVRSVQLEETPCPPAP